MTEVNKLIKVARDYVESAKIDENNNGQIDEGRELNRLLAGTAATSIEDLTVDNIKQKMLENDTEKLFTAFMTQKGLESTTSWNNGSVWVEYLGQVEADIFNCRDKTSLPTALMVVNFDNTKKDTDNMVKIIEENSNVDSSAYKYFLENLLKNLNQIEESLKTFTFFGDNIVVYDDPNAENDGIRPFIRKDSVGLYQCNLSQHLEFIQNLQAELNAINQEEINAAECLPVLKNISEQITAARNDFTTIMNHYNNMLKNDEEYVRNLHKSQNQFMKDGIATDEEKEEAKKMLAELIENVSPWTRELLLQQAEAAYRYDADYQPEENISTEIEAVRDSGKAKVDNSGFIKVVMPKLGVVLMNKSTGEIRTLDNIVIKQAIK